ncbi:putative F-box protein At4g05475 [Bidens hawaiensis]|uniref:putative F-box protein At4g05475 n=1 Tax=Bidens hawaiensis TaxID=980011 RepID=UPI00404A741A
MPPKTTSYRGRSKVVAPKPKQVWRVKQPLPADIMRNILQRVGLFDRIHTAQKVCTAWREYCNEPFMYRVICMKIYTLMPVDMCKLVVDRSQGQLLDLTIIGFCDQRILEYVFDRSSKLRRLEIVHAFELWESWSEALNKVSLLEELSLVETGVFQKDIEAAGRHCPLLKTLKVNYRAVQRSRDDSDDIALAIGKNLPELTHLELIGNSMTNAGLQAILDGCRHLESLDLRLCAHLDLEGDLGERCTRQIKHLKLLDSLEDFPYTANKFNY